ncbi:MAG: methyltransferase domain-containing protein [Desulfuromonadales bacterium]|nr:methyltransferase domain-containing protein [Desulfuromonadales bacterium]
MTTDLKTDSHFECRDDFIRYATFDAQEVIDKNNLIVNLCQGKKVLDLGCIDHSFETANELGDSWLHKRIKGVARELVGIDILSEDIGELRKAGYDIREENVENFFLNETFETIVAGDLIEHLSNIGLFLESVRKHMTDDTLFIVTTPNPFSFEQMMKAVFNNKVSVNDQHTVWLNPHVCWELFTRASLRIVGFYWVDTRFKVKVRKRYIGAWLNRLSEWVMLRKLLCRRDFAVILRKA